MFPPRDWNPHQLPDRDPNALTSTTQADSELI